MAKEVKALRTDQIEHRDLLERIQGKGPFEAGVGDKQRREHRGDDADRESQGKPLDWTTGEPVENAGGQELRDVGVKNGAESLAVRGLHGGPERLAYSELLAEALVDEHIRIHSDPQTENKTRYAGQREHAMEHAERTDDPRVGETLRVSRIWTGTRRGFSSTLASSRASFSVNRPVIWA